MRLFAAVLTALTDSLATAAIADVTLPLIGSTEHVSPLGPGLCC